MSQMYRPGGITKFFRSAEEGKKAGFYASFNEMAQAQKANKAPAPVVLTPAAEAEPAPEPAAPLVEPDPNKPLPVLDEPDDMKVESDYNDPCPPPAPAAATPRRPCPDMELGEVKALGLKYGLDTTVHHMTLRAQVEEKLNAESGSD